MQAEELEPEPLAESLPVLSQPPAEKLQPAPAPAAAPAPAPEPEPLAEVPAPETTSEPVVAYECTLRRDGNTARKLGLSLDYWETSVQIVGLVPGAVEIYNENAPPGRNVLQHDFIVGVNGKTELQKMKALLATEQEVTLQIKRPTRRTVKVSMEGGSSTWGLKLLYQRSSSSCISVEEVMPAGVFQKYNQPVYYSAQVRRGDFIESVNGMTGSAAQMYEELKRAKSIEVVFLKLAEEA